MKKSPLFFLLLCCSLLLGACKDDDDNPSREEMLMNKRWQISALSVASLLGSINYYDSFQPCQKDNYVEFRNGGVLLIDEGPTKCNAVTPQQAQGTWSLDGDILRINGVAALGVPADDLELTVKELTSSSLSAEFTETVSGFTVKGSVSLKTL